MPTERPPPAAVVPSGVYFLYTFWSPALRGSDPSLARIRLARRGLLYVCDTGSYLGRVSFWSVTLTEEEEEEKEEEEEEGEEELQAPPTAPQPFAL